MVYNIVNTSPLCDTIRSICVRPCNICRTTTRFAPSLFFNRRDLDGRDQGHVAVNFGEALGRTRTAQVVSWSLSPGAESPAEYQHVSGRERERQFFGCGRFLSSSASGLAPECTRSTGCGGSHGVCVQSGGTRMQAHTARRGITGVFFEGHRR